MSEYSKECLEVFLKNQHKLFRESVADTPEEAEIFLEDCMAVVCQNLTDVKKYFEESGTDTTGMSDADFEDACEVFALPGGKYLIVEG